MKDLLKPMISLKDSRRRSKPEKYRPKIIVILGPTASGKSDLAVSVAKKFDGEVISADSRQVYKDLDLGSGKITKKEMRDIPHHLLDVSSPKKTFTVKQYKTLSKRAINKILKRGKMPIICGGTGLYIDALVYDMEFPEVPPNAKLRKKLEKLATEVLFEKIIKLDAATSKRIDKHNRRRLIRALEIIQYTKKPIPSIQKSSPYDVIKIGIKINIDKLENNIKKRLEKRLKKGMLKEVETLNKNGLSWQKLDDLGLEYRYISRYLRGMINKDEMKDLIIKESLKYAKRQMTWFKRDKNIIWISPNEAYKPIKKFLEYKKTANQEVYS